MRLRRSEQAIMEKFINQWLIDYAYYNKYSYFKGAIYGYLFAHDPSSAWIDFVNWLIDSAADDPAFRVSYQMVKDFAALPYADQVQWADRQKSP